MKVRSDLILWAAESFKRWGESSPKFFKVWRTVNAVILSLAGVPLVLSQLDIILTGRTQTIVLWVVAFSAAYGWAMNALTVAKPPDSKPPVELPFTAKKAEEQTIKAEQIINNTLK